MRRWAVARPASWIREIVTREVQVSAFGDVTSIRYSNGNTMYVVSATAAATTHVVLPDAASCVGQWHTIKGNSAGNSVLITSAGGLVESTTTASSAVPLFSMTFVSDGANWWRIAGVP